jgi:hypothetical protein
MASEKVTAPPLVYMMERRGHGKTGSGLSKSHFPAIIYLMARPLRIELSGGLYHVTSRGDRREDIYFAAADREA